MNATTQLPAEMIEGITGLVHELINRVLGKLTPDDHDDAYQDAVVELLDHVIPAFNPTRGVAFSTFAYGCLRNFFVDQRKIQQRHRIHTYLTDTTIEPIALDRFADRTIERLAAAIQADPCGVLGGACSDKVIAAGADFDQLEREVGSRATANKGRLRTTKRILRLLDDHPF